MLSLLLASFLPAVAGLAASPNLLYNGDFESPSTESPPPGWAMWGAQAYKDPGNYGRDTTNPHAGQACFRIHHPANTEGYIVSAPEPAIPARPNTMLTVSFWARTDVPGPSLFAFTAYETIAPYVDAPAPGSWIINVGRDWQPFTFTVYEGWDYFAERSRLLMLTFFATTDPKLAKTLWIDDVVVGEQPSPRKGRMTDERSLRYEPLQHRLQPGETLDFTVDAAPPLRPVTRDAAGISFHRVAGWTGQPYDRAGRYTLAPEVEQAIRDLHLPMTRFYAVGDEPFGLEGSLDRAAEVLRKVGIPAAHTVLELEEQGATSQLAPEVWARAARYSVSRGYGFRLWEVANEPYLPRPTNAFRTPDEYAAHVRAVAAAVRHEQPGSRIGIATCDDQRWGNYVLRAAAGSYDFVVGHYYALHDIDRRRFEVLVLTENYRTLDRILQVNALLRAYNPHREVYQLDTEWGAISGGPNGEVADAVDRNANIIGTLHRAVRLIYYAREGMLRGASSWQMLNRLSDQGFGVLAQEAPRKRFMVYWLYYYFTRHVGDAVLDTRGTAPFYTPAAGDDPFTKPGEYPGPLTPVLVSLSADRQSLYVVVANGSWTRAVPCRMALHHFAAVSAKGVTLSSSDPDAKPLLERKENFVRPLSVAIGGEALTCTLPPHSVSFVTARRR
jgi:hypothetical protein